MTPHVVEAVEPSLCPKYVMCAEQNWHSYVVLQRLLVCDMGKLCLLVLMRSLGKSNLRCCHVHVLHYETLLV